MIDHAMEPRFHRRGCPQHVHPSQRDPTVIAICTCGGVDPDPRIAALTEALEAVYTGMTRQSDAADVLAALPPGWCGHAVIPSRVEIDAMRAEIARLNTELDAARRLAASEYAAAKDEAQAEIERLSDQIARQAETDGTLAMAFDIVRTESELIRLRKIEKAFNPERLANEFAMKFGLREDATFPQAVALERGLATFLRAVLEAE